MELAEQREGEGPGKVPRQGRMQGNEGTVPKVGFKSTGQNTSNWKIKQNT